MKKKKNKKKVQKIKRNRIKRNSKINFNSLLGGLFVGIANIIPGVSGGTMLVIFNLFDKLMYAISDIFKKKTDTRKQSIILLFEVLLGAAIGIVLFAKLLGITLEYLEAETIFWFMGLILFSVPIVIKSEMKGEKFNILFFLIGFIFIITLQYLKMQNPIPSTGNEMNVTHFIMMIICGLIGGATMIFPGVSGSMVLLVIGKYEQIRSYLDNLTNFDTNSIISLCFFGIGVVLGIVLSAKGTNFLLRKYKGKTVSLILGFIIASALILPFNIEHEVEINTIKICGIIASIALGGAVIYYINRLQEKHEKKAE